MRDLFSYLEQQFKRGEGAIVSSDELQNLLLPLIINFIGVEGELALLQDKAGMAPEFLARVQECRQGMLEALEKIHPDLFKDEPNPFKNKTK